MALPAASFPRFTFEQYLELEADSCVRHEFIRGLVVAMAGGSPEHNALCANLTALLARALEGHPCRVHSSDQRVRIQPTGKASYPDLSVFCGTIELDPDDPKRHTATNPSVLIEVLSPSTAEYDRGEKREHYLLIPSLRALLLFDHAEQRVEVWSRADESTPWSHVTHETVASIPALGVELSLEAVYRDGLTGESLAR